MTQAVIATPSRPFDQSESDEVTKSEQLLLSASFSEAGVLASSLLASRGQLLPSPLRERALNVLIQAYLHLQDPRQLDASISQAGGLVNLPCKSFLLLCLGNLMLDRTKIVEQNTALYIQHNAPSGTLTNEDLVAIHRLVAIELHCKKTHDYAAAYRWLHNARNHLHNDLVNPILDQVSFHKQQHSPPDVELPVHTAAGSIMTMTGDFDQPTTPAYPDTQETHSMHLVDRASALFKACTRQSTWSNVLTRMDGVLQSVGTWQTLVAAVLLYALYVERKWLRTVLGAITRQCRQAGVVLTGGLWEIVRMALALAPSPAAPAPVGMRR